MKWFQFLFVVIALVLTKVGYNQEIDDSTKVEILLMNGVLLETNQVEFMMDYVRVRPIRPQKRVVTEFYSLKEVHSVKYNNEIIFVSGSNNLPENISICLDRHREQKQSGLFISLLGASFLTVGILVNPSSHQEFERVSLLFGSTLLFAGTVFQIDSYKWLNKKRTHNKMH